MTVLNVGIQNLREMGQLVHQLRPWDRFPSAAVFSWSSAKVEGHLVIKVCKCFTDVFCYLSTNFHPILFSGFGCSHFSPYKRIILYMFHKNTILICHPAWKCSQHPTSRHITMYFLYSICLKALRSRPSCAKLCRLTVKVKAILSSWVNGLSAP